MRWRPDATTITGSPSITNTIDLAVRRAGHVRDHEVEGARAGSEARGLSHDRGRREAADAGQDLCAHGLPGALEVLHRVADDVQAHLRALAPDRQRGHHRGNAVAERAA